jgi:hypothetical protein
MKRATHLFGPALPGLAALALAFQPRYCPAQEPPLTMTVLKVSGSARYSDGFAWHKLKAGVVLKPGCTIQTAKSGSTADLLLGEPPAGMKKKNVALGLVDAKGEPMANMVRLYGDSALEVLRLAGAGEDSLHAELNLRAGQMLGTVRKLAPESRYEVTYTAGAVGAGGVSGDARGSVFVLSASGSLSALAGQVVIAAVAAGKDVNTQVVSAEQQFDPATGQVVALAADAPERALWRAK